MITTKWDMRSVRMLGLRRNSKSVLIRQGYMIVDISDFVSDFVDGLE